MHSALAAYVALQRAVLDCTDSAQLIPTLLKAANKELGAIGFSYTFCNVIFFDDHYQKKAAYYLRFQEEVVDEAVIDVKGLLDGQTTTRDLLTAGKLVLSDHSQAILDKTHRATPNLIIAPVHLEKHLRGILILGTDRPIASIGEDEQAVIEVLANKVASVYRLQDMQTSLTEITQEVYKTNAQLHQLDKLKDDFVSVASHELRTPMTAIKSYLWMALNKKKQELSPDLERYLDRAYLSVDRLITLVNDMLNVSRIEGGRIALTLAPTNIVDLAHEVQEEVATKALEKHLTVVVNDAAIPQVLCDKDKIHEVLLNFVGNSLKFTPANGTIMITFSQHEQEIEVDVIDTGHGIAKEDLPRLFAKFGRLDNSYVAMAESGGTGLGLYISKSLVELHKGRIWGASEGINKGATFSFTLPIVGTELAKKLEAEAPKPMGEVKGLEKTTI